MVKKAIAAAVPIVGALGLAEIAKGVAVVTAGSLAGAEIVKRTPQYQAMTQEEKVRRALRMQPGVRFGEGYERYMGTKGQQNITIEAKNTFQFDGTLSSTEQARLMEDWANAIDEGFVKPLTKRLEDGFRR